MFYILVLVYFFILIFQGGTVFFAMFFFLFYLLVFCLESYFIRLVHQSIQIYNNSDITEKGTAEISFKSLYWCYKFCAFMRFYMCFMLAVSSFFKFASSSGIHEDGLLDSLSITAILVLAFIPKPDASCGVHNCINLEVLTTFRG